MFIFTESKLYQFLISRNIFFRKVLIHKKLFKPLSNNKGMAIVETVPLLVVFIVLMTYAMGLWGSVHAGILTSIAARSYAFETMRNRSALYHFRETNSGDNYAKSNFRFHSVKSSAEEARDQNDFIAEKLPISFAKFSLNSESANQYNSKNHHAGITHPDRNLSSALDAKRVSPIWIMVGYGYCLTLECRP